jgi:hypothetical protein
MPRERRGKATQAHAPGTNQAPTYDLSSPTAHLHGYTLPRTKSNMASGKWGVCGKSILAMTVTTDRIWSLSECDFDCSGKRQSYDAATPPSTGTTAPLT